IRPDPLRRVQRRDSALAGFGVRVTQAGVRTYFVQYRDKRGRTRRLTIGKHGVVTTEEARRLALRALGDVTRGGNPAAERKDERTRTQGATVGDVLKRYM